MKIQLAEGLYQFIAGGGGEPEVLSSQEEPPTSEQEEAATAYRTPVLVDAGPGTGKTKTLVRRIVHLIRELEVAPEKLLVLTFSNEAAGELQTRIQSSLGAEVASRVRAATFHGFGVMLLNALGHHLGLDVDFSILDEVCQEELVSELLGRTDCEPLLDIKNPEETAAEVVRQINYLKDRLIGPKELAAAIENWTPSPAEQEAYARSIALLRLFEEYEQAKGRRNSVDFADLILLPHRLLSTHPDLREGVRQEFLWVLVDEYQDVSRATALLLKEICSDGNPPWVVGDARQAIYRFRGAEPENVRRFAEDFPNARTFHLSENYRSCEQVINTINHLAEWLEDPSGPESGSNRWHSGRQVESYGDPPASILTANSDAAEYDSIVRKIQDWVTNGLPCEHVAVLARRNIDVRNIALKLKRAGIRAITSGLLTAEGAGGDLAAVLSLNDHRQAISRVTFALCRNQAAPNVLNDVVAQLMASDPDSDDELNWIGSTEVKRIAAEVFELWQSLRAFLQSGDGWTVLCEFLFFSSRYLRELLSNEDDAEASVQLEEVLSALSLAAGYRFTHPHVHPRTSRLGLAQRMRELLTHAAPGLVPPRSFVGAVRVMTCHASKGLQFPAVIVAGQSLPDIRSRRECLPLALRPDRDLDALQAESLLFVGVSRAERAVLISYAISASGRPGAKLRRLPNLLLRLRDSQLIPVTDWTIEVAGDEQVTIGRVWGGEEPEGVSTFSLGSGTCRIRTYLEEHLGARFRGRVRPLYPEFVQHVRSSLRRIIKLAIENSRSVTESDATKIVEEEWPLGSSQEHPHFLLYRPRALRWACALARSFDPQRFSPASLLEEPFQWTDENGVSRPIKLQLIAEFDAGGERFAIALQVGSAGDSVSDVLWSKLKDYERLPFVLLYDRHGDLQPRIFFGEQGEIRAFRWSFRQPAETTRKEAVSARAVFRRLTSGLFDAKVTDWGCDRCACRIICPVCIGAVPGSEPGRA